MEQPGVSVVKKTIAIGTDEEGNAKTVMAGYFKFGFATLLGDTFGTGGTSVLEVYED